MSNEVKRKRRFIGRWVFTIHMDLHNNAGYLWHYDRQLDAYRAAAIIAEARYRDQINFLDADKARHQVLWEAKDYKGVVTHWGEIMSETTSHQDFIHVRRTRLRVRLSPKRAWKQQTGVQDPDAVYLDGVPTLRRSSVLAEEALRLYASRTGLTYEGDIEAATSDLLTDLRHFCDREGIAFDTLLATADHNYSHEINGEP